MFKVGDRVVRRIGFLGEIDPNSPIGTVEALRTFEEDVCSNGGVRVLWEGNKRGYWTESSNLKLQPKPKQSKSKFKVGDRVELYNCFCEEYNGKQGTIVKICKEIKSFSAVEVRLDQYCCGSWFVRIFVGNLKLLLKEEQKKPAFLSVSGELVEVEVKQESKKEKLSWAALDELIAKNNAMKFEVGDIVRWIGNCCNCVCGKVVDIEQKADCPIKVRWDLIEFAGFQQNYIPGSYQEANLRLATEEEKSIREAYLAASRRCVSGMKDKTACLESKVSQLQEKLNAIAKLAK